MFNDERNKKINGYDVIYRINTKPEYGGGGGVEYQEHYHVINISSERTIKEIHEDMEGEHIIYKYKEYVDSDTFIYS